jgi:hypothetical protein
VNSHVLRLRVEYREVNDLKLNHRNARTHSRKQVAQIAASIRQFGFTNPVLIYEHDEIIAGHGRHEAARSLGLATLPTIRLEHLSPAEKRALMLADNKLALNAGWDEDKLRVELAELSIADMEFDVGITGFESARTQRRSAILLTNRLSLRRMSSHVAATSGSWVRIGYCAATP